MSSHDHIPLPLGPGRLRVTATYCAYREHGRTAATMAAYGHLHGWLTGALRTTVDGQRWVNFRVPGTRRLRRFAGGAAEALVLFVPEVAITSTVTIHLRGIATYIAIVIGVGVLLADAAIAIRYQWLRRRYEPLPPPPPRCAVITNLAKDADAKLADALALKRDMELWLDGHDLALRIQARPRLAPIYLRLFSDLREVGTAPSMLSNETVTTLDRTPRHGDR